ncbi:MAG: 8-oxo-dGTP diphosphatase [Erysipelotrichaceae bacterium]
MNNKEVCILTNMVMVYDQDKILVQERLNPNWPGISFPGGHVDEEESFVCSAIREVKEETGLDIKDLKLCGMKQFTIKGQYRYIVFFYKTNQFEGELCDSEEGRVFWIRQDELDESTCAEGFLEMLKIFNEDTLSENYHYFDQEWKEVNY